MMFFRAICACDADKNFIIRSGTDVAWARCFELFFSESFRLACIPSEFLVSEGDFVCFFDVVFTDGESGALGWPSRPRCRRCPSLFVLVLLLVSVIVVVVVSVVVVVVVVGARSCGKIKHGHKFERIRNIRELNLMHDGQNEIIRTGRKLRHGSGMRKVSTCLMLFALLCCESHNNGH